MQNVCSISVSFNSEKYVIYEDMLMSINEKLIMPNVIV